jgi:purine-cytosine permease-like protein
LGNLGIVGYWSACFTAILVAEHIFFRKMRFDAYDPSQWASPRLLPPGIAGITAFLLPYAVIIPCMSQVWYVGPVAKKGTGDLGVFVGWGAAFLLYLGLRWLERRWLEKRKEGLSRG